jgi:hypothetical protein
VVITVGIVEFKIVGKSLMIKSLQVIINSASGGTFFNALDMPEQVPFSSVFVSVYGTGGLLTSKYFSS